MYTLHLLVSVSEEYGKLCSIAILQSSIRVSELHLFFRVCIALFCSPLESFLFVVTASHFRPRELLVPFPYSRSAAGSTPHPPATPNFLMRFGYIHVYRPRCQPVTAVHHSLTAMCELHFICLSLTRSIQLQPLLRASVMPFTVATLYNRGNGKHP